MVKKAGGFGSFINAEQKKPQQPEQQAGRGERIETDVVISVTVPRSRIYTRKTDRKTLIRTSFYVRPEQVEKLKRIAGERNPTSNMSQLVQDLIDDHLE